MLPPALLALVWLGMEASSFCEGREEELGRSHLPSAAPTTRLASAHPAEMPAPCQSLEHPRWLLLCRFEEALQEARQVDKLLLEGPGDDYLEEKFPLLGVPITVKEAFSLHGGCTVASLQLHWL